MNLPPRMSDEDLDYILDRRPVWVDNPDWSWNPHLPDSIAQIKMDISTADMEDFESEGWSERSWKWEAPNKIPDNIDEYGPLSIPRELEPAS